MHHSEGYVPVTYSTRLALTHVKAALAILFKKNTQPSSVNSSQYLQIATAAADTHSLPQAQGCHITPIKLQWVESVLISKYLFIHPIRNLVKATTEILQNTQTGTKRPVCYYKMLLNWGKSRFSEEVCFHGKAWAWGLTALTPRSPQ